MKLLDSAAQIFYEQAAALRDFTAFKVTELPLWLNVLFNAPISVDTTDFSGNSFFLRIPGERWREFYFMKLSSTHIFLGL